MTQTLARVLMSLTVFALAFSAGVASAALPEALQRKGDESKLFYDFTGKVPATKAEEIDRKLLEASQASGIAAVLVVVQRMGDYEGMPTKAPDFAYALAKEWRVGNPKNGKGILLLFSLGDRKFHAVKSKNLQVSITDQIGGAMKGEVTYALSQGDVAGAMEKAAQKIADKLPPDAATGASRSGPTGNPTANNRPRDGSTPVGFVPAEGRPQPFERQTRSSGGWGWVILVVGGIILVIVIISVVGAFSSARTYGGYGGGYGGYGYPGYGYGYGGGDGGFFSGMMMGGLMGNMFGGGRSVEHHYHDVGGSSASAGSSGFDLGSSGSSFGSWGGGGDSSGGSWGGSSFTGSDGGGFSGFGGGDFGGGSSGGEW